MEDLINYIKPELLVVALALYFIGMFLKKIDKLKDNYIPLILGTIGIVACVVYLGLMSGWNVGSFTSGVVQGILCAACSTYVNQLIKQMLKLNKVDDKTAKTLEKIVDEEKE